MRIRRALFARPTTWKGWLTLLVVCAVLAAAITVGQNYVRAHPGPAPKHSAPAAFGVHHAELMSVPVGLPPDAAQHCGWYGIWFCHVILQHDLVAEAAWLFASAQTDAEIVTAIAFVCMAVGALTGGIGAAICVGILAINWGHTKDVVAFANAADEDACIDLAYVQAPGGPPIPWSITGKAQDGGWCYDGFLSGGCEWWVSLVNGWDVWHLVDEQPRTCQII